MIELRTLGALELTSAESNAVGSILAQPRRAALLSYLALALPRGFHRRDTLFALFWPEDDAERARHALRQSIYFLRRALSSKTIVSRGDEELALAPDQVRCDVWEFEAAIAQGRPADALALYRGELLAGFHISAAPDFERWLDQERGRVRRLAMEAAWALAAEREREGDAAGAADAARRAVAFSPTDETALRRLMLLLERVGDRAAAMRAYEAFAWTLEGEYQLQPSPETEKLVARLRAESERPGRPNPRFEAELVPRHRSGTQEANTAVGLGVASAWPVRDRAFRGRMVAVAAGLALLVSAGWALWNPAVHHVREIRRLAVLPLANLTGDPGQDFLVAGLHDALVTELSQVSDLTVISRQSTLRYQGSKRPAPDIARELGVEALLEGSVSQGGDSFRIAVQLVRARPEEQVWTGTYHRTVHNALSLQGEVARAVARAAHARVAPEPEARLAAPLVSPEAQEAYLKGLYEQERQQMLTLGVEGPDRLALLRAAIPHLERATALAPEWAAAHARLARAYHWLASSYPGMEAEFYPKSKAAALRALELDPNEAQAHASLGFVLFNYEWDWTAAEREIRRALELDPNSHHWIYALYLAAAGRYEEAIASFKRAEERNPLIPMVKFQLASAYGCAGRHDEAITELNELRARLGGSPGWLRASFAREYAAKQMHAEAAVELEKAVALSDSDPEYVATLAYVYAGGGRLGDARELVPWLERRSGRWTAPELYVALGDTGRAVAVIESAYKESPSRFVYFRCDPSFQALRSHSGIREMVRRIGFPGWRPE